MGNLSRGAAGIELRCKRIFPWEVLIDSGDMDCGLEWIQIKARIAANSTAIGKICNTDMAHSRLQDSVHELIRASLVVQSCR